MSSDVKFDSFKGRLASHGGSAVPSGLSATTVKESPKLIWAQNPHPPAPGFWDDYPRNLVKKYQTYFQKSDGLPVHLKKGMKDRLIYSSTMGITIFGTIFACYTLYKMTKKD
ncbi:putative cytochrome c oxidase subunit 7A-related protein, mitochondrial [Apostichopus japonicus]|uniref:Putative cytochrome c oxidase subunit 7A-related protein, mitochondrial n=1 Tax=Stichopus japonicus TaxID=307972 RepID=A0A2G8KDI1_STIJA|nr:putative cytochrome c oxidase subunit 7A-related protein, mitochondrial [Apostichopus japonicus]